MHAHNAKTRFSERASDYSKYRPSYPAEIVQFILQHCSVNRSWVITDIGSGTGISTNLLLSLLCRVVGVEPNEKMRQIAERNLGDNPLYSSVVGSAEETNLPSSSVNMVASFQAFHWFEREKTRKEFRRILDDSKWVLIVWNDRVTDKPGFLEGYEGLLKNLPEYTNVNHRNVTIDDVAAFVGSERIIRLTLPYSQRLDWDGLKGRFSSSSYTPKPGTPEAHKLLLDLKGLFDNHQVRGRIEFMYNTEIYLAQMR